MAKTKQNTKRETKREEAAYVPKPDYKDVYLQKFKKEGYDVSLESGVIFFKMKKEQYAKEEEREKIREAVRKSGYNSSWGMKSNSEFGMRNSEV